MGMQYARSVNENEINRTKHVFVIIFIFISPLVLRMAALRQLEYLAYIVDLRM